MVHFFKQSCFCPELHRTLLLALLDCILFFSFHSLSLILVSNSVRIICFTLAPLLPITSNCFSSTSFTTSAMASWRASCMVSKVQPKHIVFSSLCSGIIQVLFLASSAIWVRAVRMKDLTFSYFPSFSRVVCHILLNSPSVSSILCVRYDVFLLVIGF